MSFMKLGNPLSKILFLALLAGAGLLFFTPSAQAAVDALFIADCHTVHAGADLDYTTVGTVCNGTTGEVLARNRAGTWAFFRTGTVNGWVPAWAVDVRGASFSALPVWTRPMRAGQYQPDGVVTASDAVLADNSIALYAGADSRYNVVGSVIAGTDVTVLAQNSAADWLFVRSATSRGWVPRAFVTTGANFDLLPVWTNPMRGAVLSS